MMSVGREVGVKLRRLDSDMLMRMCFGYWGEENCSVSQFLSGFIDRA